MTTSPDLDLDRCAGVLLGLAAGDALGAGYEFGTPPRGDAAMIGGGLGQWDPGEWTDDTQMAISIAEEAATGTLDPIAVAGRFLDWYRSGPADVGLQTSGVLSRAETAGEVTATAAQFFEEHPSWSAGNGSLMRTAPVALAALGDDDALLELAMAISALTHGDPLAGEACVLWCVAIDRAVREDHFEGIREGIALLPPDRRAYWQERLQEAEAGPPSRFTPNGFVVTALQAAISAIWNTPVPAAEPCRHLQDALHAAVRIGHDTDTVAAIAGSLLGAKWGSSAVPVDWQLMLRGWPGHLGRDLVRLGVLAATHGRSDASGWPDADDLTGYYHQHFPAEPFSQPLNEDNGVLIANVYGAAETKADVTVSLCRMGRTQLPASSWAEIRLLDSDAEIDNPNLDFILHDVAASIVRWRAEGKTVLVHCVQAERRTPAIAAAFLSEKLHISGEQALQRIQAQVPGARPNRPFQSALARLWPTSGEKPS
jgi:ADP-ribosyl-[dinitrogen reductase] hydrolase